HRTKGKICFLVNDPRIPKDGRKKSGTETPMRLQQDGRLFVRHDLPQFLGQLAHRLPRSEAAFLEYVDGIEQRMIFQRRPSDLGRDDMLPRVREVLTRNLERSGAQHDVA